LWCVWLCLQLVAALSVVVVVVVVVVVADINKDVGYFLVFAVDCCYYYYLMMCGTFYVHNTELDKCGTY